ncbi:XAC2610-related protein [Clostridium sp. DL1XJH146]
MKKLSIMVMIVMMVGTLAACGNNSDNVDLTAASNWDEAIVDLEGPTTEEVDKEVPETKETETKESPDEVDTKTPEKTEVVTINSNSDNTGGDVTSSEELSGEAKVSENEDGTLTVDYVITANDGTTHSFSEKPDFNKSWYEMYKEAGGELYEFTDFNFDGQPDIRTQQYGAMVNQYYNIRIWNASIGEFELNQDYMALSNPEVNEEKKQIFTTNYDRGLGNYSLYEVKDGVLTEIAAIEVEINNDGSIGYTETIGAGEGKTITSVSEIDSIWEGYKVNIQ